jgi:hypothetical protein
MSMELVELSMHVDGFIQIRAERLAADKVAATLKSEENYLQELILAEMISTDMNAVGGSEKLVKRQKSEGVVVDDWDAVFNYILNTGNTHLLQKRIAVSNYKELLEEGDEVDGIHTIELNKLSVSKL